MKSNNEPGAPTAPESRSRVDQGTESAPLVLYAGARRCGRRSGFLFEWTAQRFSLEMPPERVRANLKAATALSKR